MSFACDHPNTPDNHYKNGAGRVGCRQCHRENKRKWRERAREIAEGTRPRIKPGPAPTVNAFNPEPLTPEAIGSRMLLEGYARYWEKYHVRERRA